MKEVPPLRANGGVRSSTSKHHIISLTRREQHDNRLDIALHTEQRTTSEQPRARQQYHWSLVSIKIPRLASLTSFMNAAEPARVGARGRRARSPWPGPCDSDDLVSNTIPAGRRNGRCFPLATSIKKWAWFKRAASRAGTPQGDNGKRDIF
jgi:hypothetical protein